MKIIISKWKFKFITFIVLAFSLQPLSAVSAENTEIVKLKIASIVWCPQICPKEVNKGYVQDIVELIFSGKNYELEIHSMPWSRAIKMVNEGTERLKPLLFISLFTVGLRSSLEMVTKLL
ncbi:hypothetical protein [Aliiglaciecola lipolytica]|uniref:Solute-binding protein family 3/N-terminal domain-containing protein n=1 Tax=Aliiglaciecola lipolytica E3 TaxID=1127673 RepID=K6XMD2_9ALTE|nr:hypothetical protein [Aliiglaciecola lipolytica]GAC12806.1 hypothetical protein GLIP_0151 [Aliiglaciecola lipolytica E3]